MEGVFYFHQKVIFYFSTVINWIVKCSWRDEGVGKSLHSLNDLKIIIMGRQSFNDIRIWPPRISLKCVEFVFLWHRFKWLVKENLRGAAGTAAAAAGVRWPRITRTFRRKFLIFWDVREFLAFGLTSYTRSAQSLTEVPAPGPPHRKQKSKGCTSVPCEVISMIPEITSFYDQDIWSYFWLEFGSQESVIFFSSEVPVKSEWVIRCGRRGESLARSPLGNWDNPSSD